jgi:hypothetical protein
MPKSRLETDAERAERYLKVIQGLKLTLKGHDEYTDGLAVELDKTLAQPRHYEHRYVLGFSVRSPNAADKVSKDEIIGGLMARVKELDESGTWLEACAETEGARETLDAGGGEAKPITIEPTTERAPEQAANDGGGRRVVPVLGFFKASRDE